jgi:chemotaxis protein MotB
LAEKKKRTAEEAGGGVPEWMVTYGDMMTLLLCFFVILVAISEVKEEKFHKVMESIREYFGYDTGQGVEPGDASASSIREQIARVLTEQGSDDPQGVAAPSELGDHVTVKTIDEGDKITIGGKVLFEEGRSELIPEAIPILDKLVQVMKGYPNKLEIRGHTGVEVLPPESPYEDLFDLAYARAKAVANHLKSQKIDKRRIRLYSGGPFDGSGDELTYEGREVNRSVDIIVSEELVPPEGADARQFSRAGG